MTMFPCSRQIFLVFPKSISSILVFPVPLFPENPGDPLLFREWLWIHDFPRFRQVTCSPAALGTAFNFPAYGTVCMFSRAWHSLHVFPRMAHVCMFSRAWHSLHVFPRMAHVRCVPALGTGSTFFGG